MPKARNSKVNEALALYQQGLKLIEIARKLEIPEGTVRRWKCTYKWLNKAEVDVFLELSCFFDDLTDVGHLIPGSSAFSESSLNI